VTLPGVDLSAADDYRSRVATLLLESDATVGRVFESWRAYVRDHHGAVFETSGIDRGGVSGVATLVSDAETEGDANSDTLSAHRLFVDTLTFAAVIDALQDRIETTFDVRVDTPADALDLTPVHEAVGASLVDGDVAPSPDAFAACDADDLRRVYERTVPASSRRVFGEYYTPPALAELGVEEAASRVDGFGDGVVVDPGCGAGAFLIAALRRKRRATEGGSGGPADALDRLSSTVVGIDVNPVAVAAARTAYLLALLPTVADADVDRLSIPVFLGDALGLADDAPTTGVEGRTSVLVGNPPWIPWERLPEAQKERLRAGPIDRLDLFDHRGASARLGHANDDLSLPFVWTCLDRYLRDGGVATFVLKRDHLRGPAGRLVRTGRVGSRSLALDHVHDFGSVDPFGGVDAAAALYVFRVGADAPDAGPGLEDDSAVPTTVWEERDDAARLTDATSAFASLSALRSAVARTETGLTPVDADDPASPWRRVDASVAAVGECDYRVRHGLKDDAKAVFSVDDDVLGRIESTHVYPYLRSKHVVKWGLFGHDRFLVPQRKAGEANADELAREAPATYDYLESNRERLEDRGSSWFDGGPFYSLFGLGPYTWAPYKVVWCRLGFKPHFAVVSTVDDPALGRKTVVPGDHCMFVACDDADEAHYLCALLNAGPYQRCLRDLAGGGKASLSKTVVSSLYLPTWEGRPRQERLATLSRRAHEVVPAYVDRSKRAYNRLTVPELEEVQRAVDRTAARFLADR
jgi:hypothetical protein